VGGAVAPVAITSAWARGLLTSSDTFVATFAPLARDPDVQEFLTDQLSETVTSSLNLPELTGEVLDGIVELGTSDRATAALTVVQGAVVAALEGVIHNSVNTFVDSDAFATVWAESLRITHTGLVNTLSGQESAIFVIGDDSTLGVNVRPVLERLKIAFVGEGLIFAANVPVVDSVIVITTSDALPVATRVYAIAIATGLWLPILAFALLVAGVLLAPRRLLAARWAAIAVVIGAAILLALEAAGRWVFVAFAPPAGLSEPVATTIYDHVLRGVSDLTVAVLIIAVVTATIAWLSGPTHVPVAVRSWVSAMLPRSVASDAIQ
jgi:hypothetical protein